MSIYFVLGLSFLNGLSVQATRVLLVLFALKLNAPPVVVGLLAATFSVFPMLLAVPAGRLADRFGSRGILMFGSVGGGMGLLVPFYWPGLPGVFVAATIIGLPTAIFNVSLQNLVGLLSNAKNRARNFSNYSLTSSINDFVGPTVAGFSIDHFGHDDTCLYIALLTVVPAAILVFRRGAMRGGSHPVKHAEGGFMSLLSEPGVRRVLATSSLLNTASNLYQFYIPVYAHGIGFSASTIGMLLSMNAAAAFFVRVILGRLIARFKEERLLAYAFFVGAASLMLIPFIKNAVLLAVISFVFGLGMGCCGPIVTMLMFSSSTKGRSGEALGLKVTLNHLTKVVSPIVFGSIASVLGLLSIFWIDALMLAAGGILSRPKKTAVESRK